MSKRLLIIDENAEYTRTLQNFINSHTALEVVGIANDGNDGQRKLMSSKPDIVLMDLMLPGLDGLSLLKHIQHMRNRPLVICQSSFCSGVCIEAARRNGASYFIFKPSALSSVLTVLLEVADLMDADSVYDSQNRDSDSARSNIHNIMRSLGFSSRYQGSDYLAESVLLAHQSPMCIRNISTGLYAALATKLHISKTSIERNIRTAISAANINGNLAAQIGKAPTNKNCIQYILSEYRAQADL